MPLVQVTLLYLGGPDGHALFGDLNWTIVILTLFYSFAGLGIAVVNNFKNIEGDRQLGLKSFPVMFGINIVALICVIMINLFKVGVAGYLKYISIKIFMRSCYYHW